jgi:hypothetical protein
MLAIRTARFEDLLLGVETALAKTISVRSGDSTTDKPNPEYVAWISRDQALLGYLLTSQTREVLMGVSTLTSSAAIWSTLAPMFSPCTHLGSVNMRITPATTTKGVSTMAEYFHKMKNYADEMSASGQPLGDEEFAAYVLTDLDDEFYNPLVSSIVTRVKPISPSELYS